MHIERIHKMIEKLTECALAELDKGVECVDTEEFGEVVDAIKDLAEAEYKSLIAKEMKEYKEEEEAEDKYLLRMFKEENKDEYKRMREQYGEEEGERRFYDDWRYKSSGRFAPKGRGTRTSRRGYEDKMPIEYRNGDEWDRDIDRHLGRMYFSAGTYSGDGRRGNSESGRDYREGRSGQMRRGYIETKQIHSDNTPEGKQKRMKELDEYMKSLSEDVTEMIGDASTEERALLKQKMQGLIQKL